jgi:hypothetical protein
VIEKDNKEQKYKCGNNHGNNLKIITNMTMDTIPIHGKDNMPKTKLKTAAPFRLVSGSVATGILAAGWPHPGQLLA